MLEVTPSGEQHGLGSGDHLPQRLGSLERPLRERRIAVMLDWDMAGPGTRLWDVANSACSWVPLLSSRG